MKSVTESPSINPISQKSAMILCICIRGRPGSIWVYIPEKILAMAAIIKLIITPGPAIFWATMPATRYMPVPQQEPMPKEVRSRVLRHFWGRNWWKDVQKISVKYVDVYSLPLALVSVVVRCHPAAASHPWCGWAWAGASLSWLLVAVAPWTWPAIGVKGQLVGGSHHYTRKRWNERHRGHHSNILCRAKKEPACKDLAIDICNKSSSLLPSFSIFQGES